MLTTDGEWDPGKDFVGATAPALAPTQKLMSIWRSPKPTIAQVHGWCVGGGSDLALCADLVIASEDARIGTPYSRMWAVPFARLEEEVAETAQGLASIRASQLAAMKLVVNHAYENMGLASTQPLRRLQPGRTRGQAGPEQRDRAVGSEAQAPIRRRKAVRRRS
jgi:Enoyl-CoA hydratase/isomerase